MFVKEIDVFKTPGVVYPGATVGIAITTNGMVKRNGCAVMGKGVALTAVKLFPGIDRVLADKLKRGGNHVHHLGHFRYMDRNVSIFSFPTKNDWRDDSDLSLIVQSAKELEIITDDIYSSTYCNNIFIPMPGCGCGNLREEDVIKALEPVLTPKFCLCSYK